MIKNLNIKKQLLILFAITTASIAYGQVGINSTSPKATLDVVAKNIDGSTPEGLIAPRLTGDQIKAGSAQYGSDQIGTIVYATSAVTSADIITQNITSNGYYYFDGTMWQTMASSNGITPGTGYNIYDSDGVLTGARNVDLDSNTLGFTGGNVGVGVTTPDTSAILDVASTTQGLLPPRVTKAQRDAILSPASGLIVYCTDCSGTIVAPTGCLSQNLGNPTTPNWTCVGSTTSASVAVSDCTGFSGTYTGNVSVGTTANYKVSITNNSFSSATINFAAGDLVLSGITGLSVGTPTFSGATGSGGNVTLTSGQTVVVTYPITGVPGSDGTLTGTWTKLSLTCTNTQLVGKGSATFTLPQTRYVASVNDGNPNITIQGIIDNGSKKIVINVPYTAGRGNYDAYTGPVISGIPGQGGDSNGFSISYQQGTFNTSGTIPVTVIVDGDGVYNSKQLLFAQQETIVTIPFVINGTPQGNIILINTGGIPDRMFGQYDNGGAGAGYRHQFIYLPVVGEDGRIWLNNNLGANYSNMNHPKFSLQTQAASKYDGDAAGSLFEWGRKGDGHELVNWLSSNNPVAVSAVTSTKNDNPTDTKYIVGLDWRISSNSALWDSGSANNPCPQGFRVPTNDELNTLSRAAAISNSTGAYNSALKFPVTAERNYAYGNIAYTRWANYWTSSPSANNSLMRGFGDLVNEPRVAHRTWGAAIRCIQE